MKNIGTETLKFVIGIVIACLIALPIIGDVDKKDDKDDELKCKDIILTQLLDSLRNQRIFVDAKLDSLKKASYRIKRKIKTVPVYVPGRFDTLSNKKLQSAMLEEYRNFNQ